MMASYVTHEMLTPLNCMNQLALRLINDPNTTQDHKRLIRIISQTILFLLSNVKENLDKSLLKANQFRAKLSQERLMSDIIDPIMDLFDEQAIAHKVQLQLVSENNTNPLLMIDKLRTQQILINLLQNAIKFSSPGQKIKIVIENLEEYFDKQENRISRFSICVKD